MAFLNTYFKDHGQTPHYFVSTYDKSNDINSHVYGLKLERFKICYKYYKFHCLLMHLPALWVDLSPLNTQHKHDKFLFLRHTCVLDLCVLFPFPKAEAMSIPLGWGLLIMS